VEGPSHEPQPICHFLKKFPIEVRNKIYELLLVNPILRHCTSTLSELESNATGWGFHTEYRKYGLSPNILLTCRQVYAEASKILYGSNSFYVLYLRPQVDHGCTHRGFVGDLPLCPLGRVDSSNEIQKLAELPSIEKVRHWRVVISVTYAYPGHNCPCPEFVDFCRTIHRFSPQTLEVLIIRRNVECRPDGYSNPDYF
jgi:hypothetical protein